MGKVKLFTHNDLDGVGCAIIGKFVFKDDIDIEYHDYNSIDTAVTKFLMTQDKSFSTSPTYEKIFVTDISVSEDVANYIDTLLENRTLVVVDNMDDMRPQDSVVFQLLDHHNTAKRLNTRKWAEVEEYLSGMVHKACGASNFLHYLKKTEPYFKHLSKNGDFHVDKLDYFIDIIRLWDTWEWTTLSYDNKEKCDLAPKYNKLLKYEGKQEFLSNCITDLLYDDNEFPYKLSAINNLKLRVLDDVEESYIKSKLSNVQIIISKKWNCTIGIVFASQYVSNLGHAIIEDKNANIDVAVMIGIDSIPGSTYISFRSRNNYDCSIMAKEFGGGGHPQSAGAVVFTSDLPDIIKSLTEEDENAES